MVKPTPQRQQSSVMIDMSVEERRSSVDTAVVSYSFLRDSVLSKYTGNSATLLSVFDAILNVLAARFDNINEAISEKIPFYVMGLYYLLPIGIPAFPYIRNRWFKSPEIHDPDAQELLTILQEHDPEFARLIAADPQEKNRILDILTSYLRYEKNQPFNLVTNLIFLTLRAVHGVLVLLKGSELINHEKNEQLHDWTTLLSTISNIAYLCIVILHNNFQKYHFPESRNNIIKNNVLQQTFFKAKSQLKLTISELELSEPLLSSNQLS